MKTATVRDLRNNFADVAKVIEEGEPIAITRRGAAFAVLTPAKPNAPRKVDWRQSAALRGRVKRARKLTARQTRDFYAAMKGRF